MTELDEYLEYQWEYEAYYAAEEEQFQLEHAMTNYTPTDFSKYEGACPHRGCGLDPRGDEGVEIYYYDSDGQVASHISMANWDLLNDAGTNLEKLKAAEAEIERLTAQRDEARKRLLEKIQFIREVRSLLNN